MDAYWECDALGGPLASARCDDVYSEFVEATGCGVGTVCLTGFRKQNPLKVARLEQCQSVNTARPDGPLDCEGTRISTPCPDWPPLESGFASAAAPEAAGSVTEPPVGDGAAEAPQGDAPGATGARSSASAPCAGNASECGSGGRPLDADATSPRAVAPRQAPQAANDGALVTDTMSQSTASDQRAL